MADHGSLPANSAALPSRRSWTAASRSPGSCWTPSRSTTPPPASRAGRHDYSRIRRRRQAPPAADPAPARDRRKHRLLHPPTGARTISRRSGTAAGHGPAPGAARRPGPAGRPRQRSSPPSAVTPPNPGCPIAPWPIVTVFTAGQCCKPCNRRSRLRAGRSRREHLDSTLSRTRSGTWGHRARDDRHLLSGSPQLRGQPPREQAAAASRRSRYRDLCTSARPGPECSRHDMVVRSPRSRAAGPGPGRRPAAPAQRNARRRRG